MNLGLQASLLHIQSSVLMYLFVNAYCVVVVGAIFVTSMVGIGLLDTFCAALLIKLYTTVSSILTVVYSTFYREIYRPVHSTDRWFSGSVTTSVFSTLRDSELPDLFRSYEYT